MFSCFPACMAAVCISSMIRKPLSCWEYSAGILIQRLRWAVRGCGGSGRGHLCLRYKTKEPFNADQGLWGLFDSCFFPFCTLLRVIFPQMFGIYRASLFLTWMNRKVSHVSKWVKVLPHISSCLIGRPQRWMEPRPQIRCFYEALAYYSLIIVGSCLLMTRSSSTENHYPDRMMEIEDVLCGTVLLWEQGFVVLPGGSEMKLWPLLFGVAQNVFLRWKQHKSVHQKKKQAEKIKPTENKWSLIYVCIEDDVYVWTFGVCVLLGLRMYLISRICNSEINKHLFERVAFSLLLFQRSKMQLGTLEKRQFTVLVRH